MAGLGRDRVLVVRGPSMIVAQNSVSRLLRSFDRFRRRFPRVPMEAECSFSSVDVFHPRLVQIKSENPLSGIMTLVRIAEFLPYRFRSITVASGYGDR